MNWSKVTMSDYEAEVEDFEQDCRYTRKGTVRFSFATGQRIPTVMKGFDHGSEAVRCKPKSVFHSTSDAARALKELEGTDSTTDTDAASQCNPSIELITGDKADKYCDVPPDRQSVISAEPCHHEAAGADWSKT